ncbi:hypothetical protein AB4120_16445 [Cupriavidus sp. 2KB_3]|uniref:hypothetical protein n=1 Tax=Cupriavidus sp. 2KB_3 TaxID=3232980 RepID=UPI003F8FAC6D
MGAAKFSRPVGERLDPRIEPLRQLRKVTVTGDCAQSLGTAPGKTIAEIRKGDLHGGGTRIKA